MSLQDFKFPLSITTSENDAIHELFVPALKQSITYDVAVGYFTSKWLYDSAEGIAYFAENGGKARWIVSPELNKNDLDKHSTPYILRAR